MTILVIGGTGFISGEMVRQLLGAGHRVTLLTRGKHDVPFDGMESPEMIRGDRRDPGTFDRALGNRRFDAVFDMIAYAPDESAEAARFFRGKTARFIHCSTVSVYMVSADIRCPITEDQATAPLMDLWPENPFGMDYGVQKRECEKILWQAHHEKLFPVTVLRPTFVSGPADPAQRDYFWMQRIADGGPLLVPGAGDHAFQQVYIEDVVRAFVMSLDCPVSIGEAYNVAGEEQFTLNEYLWALAALMDRTPAIAHLPQEEFDKLSLSKNPRGDVFPFNTRRPAIFSLDKVRRDIGYRSSPFREWMGKTISWWMGTPRADSLGYDLRGQELSCAADVLNHRVRQGNA